jgi:Papain family cysteine protease
VRRYGWKRPLKPSPHPMLAQAPGVLRPALPAVVDLSPECSPIADQGDSGACTGETAKGLAEFCLKKRGTYWAVSAFGQYYAERLKDGDVTKDAGSTVAMAFTVLQKVGVFAASIWPDTPENLLQDPPTTAWKLARLTMLTDPIAVPQDLYSIQSVLASGYPVGIGIECLSIKGPDGEPINGIEGPIAAQTGIVNIPTSADTPDGGHAVLVVGYDSVKKLFKFRNSWGESWGDKGYGYLPYDYAMSSELAEDFHTGRVFT